MASTALTDDAYLIGLDVGTTGAKAVLINSTGRVLGEATREYPLSTPRPNWSEQDPADWHVASVGAIRDVLAGAEIDPRHVVALGLTGQMHGATLLDADGAPLRPAILWNDQRTAAQCDEITRRVGAERVMRLTGNPVLTGFTAPKVLWVREHEPEIYSRIASLLLPKDYVRFCLTGARFSDVTDASGASLFDVAQRRWSDEMLEPAGVRREWLPEVTESPVVSARLSADGGRATGLLAGIPVVAGAGDQAAQAIGAGILSEGAVSVTIGTSGVVFAACDEYRVEPHGKLHAFCHAAPGKWHLMGVMLSAGGSLRWYRDCLCAAEQAEAAAANIDAYERILAPASAAPAGCEGLLFLPYLTGERTPHADPDARGAFVGLTLRHTKAHLTRAVLEGVAFGLRDSLELMRGLGTRIESLRVSGGGARSALWRQILADVFDHALETPSPNQGAAFGAALLAGVGARVFESVEAACRRAVRATPAATPGRDAATYARVYERFCALYPALAAEFRAYGAASCE